MIPRPQPEPVWRDLFTTPSLTLLRTDYPSGLVQPPHVHEYASITLILQGTVEESVGTRVQRGGPLSVVLKHPGVQHSCRWGSAPTRTFSVEIEPAYLETCSLDSLRLPYWAWTHRSGSVTCLLALHEAMEQGSLANDADDLMLELLASVGTTHRRDESTPPPWLRPAVEEMSDVSPRRPPTRDLAKRAGVHPVHFARTFRRHVGVTPTEYARWLRLRVTVEALTDEPPDEVGRIAHRCGYSDHSHLCRDFKRSLRLTPSAFRSLVKPVAAS